MLLPYLSTGGKQLSMSVPDNELNDSYHCISTYVSAGVPFRKVCTDCAVKLVRTADGSRTAERHLDHPVGLRRHDHWVRASHHVDLSGIDLENGNLSELPTEFADLLPGQTSHRPRRFLPLTVPGRADRRERFDTQLSQSMGHIYVSTLVVLVSIEKPRIARADDVNGFVNAVLIRHRELLLLGNDLNQDTVDPHLNDRVFELAFVERLILRLVARHTCRL